MGEMYGIGTQEDVKVHNGFAITAESYRGFLREFELDARIKKILKNLHTYILTQPPSTR
ncbi:MAG: PEP/pyruvate-binding domain-containing protein [Nitrospirales bacterium]